MKKIKNYTEFLIEGKGISNIIKSYSTFIYDEYLDQKSNIQLDLDYEQLPLMDLRMMFKKSDRYYGLFNPNRSIIKDNKLYDIEIYIEYIDINNKSEIIGIITHELTHIMEFYQIMIKNNKDNIKIRPHHIDIKIAYKKLGIPQSNVYYEFVYLLYLSLDTEINARTSQVYNFLMNINSTDYDFLLNELTKNNIYNYSNILSNFNYNSFINKCINKLGLESLLIITNKLTENLSEIKNNKNKVFFTFLREVKTKQDLINYYKSFNDYFIIKSSKQKEKYECLIKEVIKDKTNPDPYKESFNEESRKFEKELVKNMEKFYGKI